MAYFRNNDDAALAFHNQLIDIVGAGFEKVANEEVVTFKKKEMGEDVGITKLSAADIMNHPAFAPRVEKTFVTKLAMYEDAIADTLANIAYEMYYGD